MSIKQHPGRIKLDFGSTVTILTTAVSDTKHCKRINGQGIFTGIVLDESQLRLKRNQRQMLMSGEGINDISENLVREESDLDRQCDDKQSEGEGGSLQPKECEEHKKHCECEVKKTQEFVILSLTCPSFPFVPGQIVWISLEQIIALAVLCRN